MKSYTILSRIQLSRVQLCLGLALSSVYSAIALFEGSIDVSTDSADSADISLADSSRLQEMVGQDA